MPTGPKARVRPADVIGCVVQVAKIDIGEQSKTVEKPHPYLTLPYLILRHLYEKSAP